ncbi:MAG: phage tail protein I [Rhizobiales bacterium 63-7]|nr:phage tail protein I [Hyphomicrobiales bacterium]OJU66651.1 MAG: phage tail protein I [Rhizobiales bacterium 63-7]
MALSDILPPRNATAFQRAFLDASGQPLPIPFRETLDPRTTPPEWLKWLAQHESVDLWDDSWSVERKRQVIVEWPEISRIKGTHEAAVRCLGFVDAEVIDSVAYPARFIAGRSALGITPLNHPAFKARWLVQVALKKPVNAFVLGRSAAGLGALRTIDLTPIHRAKEALRVAKAPETEYLVSFAWRRRVTFGDRPSFGDDLPFSGFIDRETL